MFLLYYNIFFYLRIYYINSCYVLISFVAYILTTIWVDNFKNIIDYKNFFIDL